MTYTLKNYGLKVLIGLAVLVILWLARPFLLSAITTLPAVALGGGIGSVMALLFVVVLGIFAYGAKITNDAHSRFNTAGFNWITACCAVVAWIICMMIYCTVK